MPPSVSQLHKPKAKREKGAAVSSLKLDVSNLEAVTGVDPESSQTVVLGGVGVGVALEIEVLLDAVDDGVDVLVTASGIDVARHIFSWGWRQSIS
jgi:hypothetical protein